MTARWMGTVGVALGGLAMLGASGPAPAGSAATTTAAAPVILTPSGDAVFTRPQVRVVVRAPAGASRTRVRLGDRDVTARFRAEGGRLVGRLAPRDGLRYGRNELVVVAHRVGKAEVRAGPLVLPRTPHEPLRPREAAPPEARARADRRRLGPPARAGCGGGQRGSARPAQRARGDQGGPAATGARHKFSLSATHGLRYGVNRLRVFVAEPQQGRYASVKRRSVVRRIRPLAAAGRDRGARPRARVRVGGRGKAARGGRLRYRWRLVRRPEGSRALIGAHEGPAAARP